MLSKVYLINSDSLKKKGWKYFVKILYIHMINWLHILFFISYVTVIGCAITFLYNYLLSNVFNII